MKGILNGMDGEMGLYVTASNFTSGVGGVSATFSGAEWGKAVRHGVGGDGPVLVNFPEKFIYSQKG